MKDDQGGLGCTVRDVGVPRMESLLQEEASGRLRGGGGIELDLVGWGQTGRRSPVDSSGEAAKHGTWGALLCGKTPGNNGTAKETVVRRVNDGSITTMAAFIPCLPGTRPRPKYFTPGSQDPYQIVDIMTIPR